MNVRLAVDCMGGDFGLAVTIPAVLDCRKNCPDAEFLLVGRQLAINQQLDALRVMDRTRLQVVHADEVVEMDDSPLMALKTKKHSSLRLAIDLVKSGEADVCVSAGNTGALMATAHFVLKMLPGISRPAIAGLIPSRRGATVMLDMGANVDCTVENLEQFALMGSCLGQLVFQHEAPSVGILNIGIEEFKGNDKIKAVIDVLRDAPINFQGSVEGHDIFMGDIDIVVCDGFVGNVVIKSMEGLSQFIKYSIQKELHGNSWLRRFFVLCAAPFLSSFKKTIDHRGYNGGYLLGLRGLVLKSHGNADAYAFSCALMRAIEAVRCHLLNNIRSIIEKQTHRLLDAGQ